MTHTSALVVATGLALHILPVPALSAGRPVSLDLQEADIHGVLRLLAEVGGLDVAVGDEVKGKITLRLSGVPWDQALGAVLRLRGLEAQREGRLLRVSTAERLGQEREAVRAAAVAARERAPLGLAPLQVHWARADDVLAEKVQGVLSERGSVTFDERTNTLLVRDLPEGLRDAAALVRTLDVPSPQVLIESSIVEATEDFARGLGVQWGLRHAGGGVVVGGPQVVDFPVPATFGSGFGPGAAAALDLALGSLDGANDLAARLTALEEAGKGKVVSRPRVVTMNNVPATIQSLTILRVKLPSTGTVINTGTGGAAETANTATEKINTGITLVVIPQVTSDGFVLLNIYAKSSVPDFSRTVEGIPTEIAREANSNVLVRDGQTVVLGGISRASGDGRRTGVPFLNRVPGLAWLFARTLTSKRREELLVFLTPRVRSGGRHPPAGPCSGGCAMTPAPPATRVILTGFMGTGKTEVGGRLARTLGWPFIDTDALIESAAGRSVSAIFAAEGEAGFRARERQAVADACRMAAAVIAVGGGALLDPENRRLLLAAGPVVCLRASPREILDRLGEARDRPLLNRDGTASKAERLARIESLLSARAAVYALASHAVDTDGRTPDQVADAVRAIMQESGGSA